MKKETCPKCQGMGGMAMGVPSGNLEDPAWICCPKCLGEKKLDWVEMIMGRKPKNPPHIKPGVYVYEIDICEMRRYDGQEWELVKLSDQKNRI